MGQAPLHPEHIKAEIRIKFGSLRGFEESRGLPIGSTQDVLRGRSVRRTAEAIAEFLGKSIAEVFPGRFAVASPDTSTNADAHRLNKSAA